MTVAHRFPASRDTVEKRAAANAIPNPTSASRNFTHTSAAADCSHWVRRAAVDGLDFTESGYVECTARSLTSAEKNEQSSMTCGEAFVTFIAMLGSEVRCPLPLILRQLFHRAEQIVRLRQDSFFENRLV